ncbi:putative mitochondrial protein, partial [Mucuna pruriens]
MGLQKEKIITFLRLIEPSSSKCLSLICLNCRLPTRVLNSISPIKRMLSFFPSSLLMLSLPSHVFGCVSFVHSHNPHRGKLDPRVVKCVFIGYPSNKKGFKCYHPLSRQFFISMDGEIYLEVESGIESLPFPTQDVQVQVQEVTKPTLSPEQVQIFIVSIDAIKTPTSVQEALKDENWVQAMKEEMEALEKNSTWEIVDRPKDKRVVGCIHCKV